jgi:monovalent cation/hydrogen antiporter
MIIFEWLLAIVLGAVLLAVLANRMAVPYPALLALGGAVLAFIPGAPRIVLESDLALALFVVPVLRMRPMTPRPAISETTGCR